MATTEQISKALDRSAKKSQAGTAGIVAGAITALSNLTPASAVQRAIASRSAGPILASPGWDAFLRELRVLSSDSSPVLKTMDAAGRNAVRFSPSAATAADFNFETFYRAARRWNSVHGSQLVTNVSDSTKEAIRTIVDQAFAEPKGVRQAARTLLDVKGFGLDKVKQQTLRRYTSDLIAQGRPADQVDRMTRERWKKLRKARSILVARTESYTAAGEASRLVWSQEASTGALSTSVYVLQWITRLIRVCPRCMALNGKTTEVQGGIFESDPVASGSFAGQVIRVRRPTVHPGCFCALRVIRREA